MEDLLRFIDDYIFEPQMYFRVRSAYTRGDFEIQWRTNFDKKWRIKHIEDATWQEIQTQDLMPVMNRLKLNIGEFEIALRAQILHAVAYADTFLVASKRLLGPATVSEAIKANAEFLDELSTAVQSMLYSSVPNSAEASPEKQRGPFTLLMNN